MPEQMKPILLVEDNRDEEELSLLGFEKANVRDAVRVARDGAEALRTIEEERAQSGPSPFRFVLLDLNLPKLNGFAVLEAIRAQEGTQEMPVVIFSSSTTQEDIDSAYRLGADRYEIKPKSFAEYIETVRRIASEWSAPKHR